jgi:hypothetical protein
MSAAQVVGDLRTLVARRVGLTQRVVFLGRDEALAQALRANGCEVMVDPQTLNAVSEAQPSVVVAFDGALGQGASTLLQTLAASGGARLVLSFANSAAASGLLRALTGKPLSPSAHEGEVRMVLARAGYRVTSRDVVMERTTPSGLAPETEAALRQLFEQLNPAAAVERLLLVAEPGAEATRVDRTPGLVSVVVGHGSRPSLKGTLGALARQLYQPMEVVVASSHADDSLVAPLKGRLGFTVASLPDAPQGTAGFNAGLALAQGQYITCLSAGDLIEPGHVRQLVTRLSGGAEAWVLASVAGQPAGPFDVGVWAKASAVDPARWLVDITRVGAFALEFADESPAPELALFVRLASTFAPAIVIGEPTLSLEAPLTAALEAISPLLHGRPLHSLVPLRKLLAGSQPESLASRLVAEAAAVDPRLGHVLKRIHRAALAARAQAKAER